MACSLCEGSGYFEQEKQMINGEMVEQPTNVHCTFCDNDCELCEDEDKLCLAKGNGDSKTEWECPKCLGQGDFPQDMEGPLGGRIGGYIDCHFCNGTGTVSQGKWKQYHDMN